MTISPGVERTSAPRKHMEPEDVEQLNLEVAKMGFLSSEQAEKILNEFYQLCHTNRAVTEGGLEYACAVLEKAYGPERADEIRKQMFVSEDIITMDDRFVQRFVHDCDPRDLVLALKTANEEASKKLLSNMSINIALLTFLVKYLKICFESLGDQLEHDETKAAEIRRIYKNIGSPKTILSQLTDIRKMEQTYLYNGN